MAVALTASAPTASTSCSMPPRDAGTKAARPSSASRSGLVRVGVGVRGRGRVGVGVRVRVRVRVRVKVRVRRGHSSPVGGASSW